MRPKDFAPNPAERNRSESYGQRLILSYDGGASFTNRIFELHHGGAPQGAVGPFDDPLWGHSTTLFPKIPIQPQLIPTSTEDHHRDGNWRS
jgi:hypothetical protein